jgi:hypothetical protein
VVAAAAIKAESVNKVFLIFVSSVREMRFFNAVHSGYESGGTGTVGVHPKLGANVTEVSAQNP